MRSVLALLALAAASLAPAGADASDISRGGFHIPPLPQSAPQLHRVSDGICGWYVILGCSRYAEDAWSTLNSLGGEGVGGWAGAHVVLTNDYPNFRDGWYCVADGPYPNRWDAESIAWREAVPDAYVKSGC